MITERNQTMYFRHSPYIFVEALDYGALTQLRIPSNGSKIQVDG